MLQNVYLLMNKAAPNFFVCSLSFLVQYFDRFHVLFTCAASMKHFSLCKTDRWLVTFCNSTQFTVQNKKGTISALFYTSLSASFLKYYWLYKRKIHTYITAFFFFLFTGSPNVNILNQSLSINVYLFISSQLLSQLKFCW